MIPSSVDRIEMVVGHIQPIYYLAKKGLPQLGNE